MVTWQAKPNEQAPALVWFALSHPWQKYFTKDPLCWTERFLPEEHGVVLYRPNITNHFSNDCSDLCGYKWFVLVCLLSNYIIYIQLLFLCIVPGQTLMKTLQYNLTCMIRSISRMERISLEGLLQPINTPWLLLLPEETTSAPRYPNFPLWWETMFSDRTLVELYKSHLGYWTK